VDGRERLQAAARHRHEDRALFGFAGLWENWKDPATEQWLRTFTIITTRANETITDLHERMPVILRSLKAHDDLPLVRGAAINGDVAFALKTTHHTRCATGGDTKLPRQVACDHPFADEQKIEAPQLRKVEAHPSAKRPHNGNIANAHATNRHDHRSVITGPGKLRVA
jgi:hypothetical protein